MSSRAVKPDCAVPVGTIRAGGLERDHAGRGQADELAPVHESVTLSPTCGPEKIVLFGNGWNEHVMPATVTLELPRSSIVPAAVAVSPGGGPPTKSTLIAYALLNPLVGTPIADGVGTVVGAFPPPGLDD